MQVSPRQSTDGLREVENPPGSDTATFGPPRVTTESPTPRTSRVRALLGRRDPLPWGIGALAFLLSLAFLAVNLSYNAWNFIPPLDDAYIHLQYAAQIGQGHFFRYNTGDPISTGASSLLYVLVMGAAYAVGFQGNALLPAAMGFGALCFALTAAFVALIGQRIMDRRLGAWAGVLVAANGALLWGSVSGMEIGLVAMLVSGSVLAFTVEAPRGRFVLAPLVSALTALSRPEAFLFTVALGAAMVWTALRKPRGSAGHTLRGLALVPLPVLAYGGQMLFYLIATGTTSANGMQAKSLLYNPITHVTDVVDETLARFHDFLRVFTGLDSFDYVFPGTLLVAILGTIYLAREKPAWRPLAFSSAGGLTLVLLAISTLKTAHSHHLRYVQPFMPILLLLAAVGLYALARLLPARRSRLLVANSALGLALVFTASEMPAWSIRLGQQSAGIRDQQVSISNWFKGHLPPGAVIAVNDVGAAAYFTNREIVDLIGLTTNQLTVPSLHGPGSLYEALSTMPEQRRPDYFSVFDSWSVHGLKDGLFAEQPVITFQLKSPVYSHRTPGSASACQASRYCNEVVVYEADWSSVGSGDLPAAVDAPGEIRDHVDVANLDAEAAHSYRVVPVHHGFQPLTSLESVSYGKREVVDSGRHVIGGEVMTVHDLTPGEPVTITSRLRAEKPLPNAYTGSREVSVVVDGRDVGIWRFGSHPDNREDEGAKGPDTDGRGWHESTFTIPGDLVTGSTVTVEYRPVQTFLAPYPDYISYGYWFSQ